MSTQDLEASMRKSVEATQRNFNTIRTCLLYTSDAADE